MSKPEKKQRFRARSVVLGRNPVAYAKALEKAMNDMHEAGYSVQVTEQKYGSLLLGALQEPEENPLARLLGIAKSDGHTTAKLSPRARELWTRALGLLSAEGLADEAVFRDELQKHMSKLLKGVSGPETVTIAKEIAAYGEAHSCGAEECRVPYCAKHIAAMLSAAGSLHIQ